MLAYLTHPGDFDTSCRLALQDQGTDNKNVIYRYTESISSLKNVRDSVGHYEQSFAIGGNIGTALGTHVTFLFVLGSPWI